VVGREVDLRSWIALKAWNLEGHGRPEEGNVETETELEHCAAIFRSTLGNRLTVRLWTLTPAIEVRILVPQHCGVSWREAGL
jgi:hypothetical protein